MNRVLLLAVLALSASCATRSTDEAGRAPALRRDLITHEEMDNRYFASAYDLVNTLRPNWLNERGVETLGTPTEIQVHYNGVHIGGVAMLREMTVPDLAYLEYVEPIAAAGRWGLGYGKGAILLSTRPK